MLMHDTLHAGLSCSRQALAAQKRRGPCVGVLVLRTKSGWLLHPFEFFKIGVPPAELHWQ